MIERPQTEEASRLEVASLEGDYTEQAAKRISAPLFTPRTIVATVIGAVAGGILGYIGIEIVYSAGTNTLINSENFTYVKMFATAYGMIIGGATAGAAAQKPTGNRT